MIGASTNKQPQKQEMKMTLINSHVSKNILSATAAKTDLSTVASTADYYAHAAKRTSQAVSINRELLALGAAW